MLPRRVLATLLFALPLAAVAQPVAVPPAVPVGKPVVEGQPPPSLSPLVDSVKSAVVNVDVQSRGRARMRGRDDAAEELWEHFFGGGRTRPRQERAPEIQQGQGSGFIVDPKGLVITNNHVVEGAISIRVRLDDGRVFDGQVLGRDPLTDVALIKLKGAKIEGLPVAKLGDSDAMKVGDYVVAIGNPFGFASSVSMGIVSARARRINAGPYDDFLQTDAAINPGNSGGPLFNLKGEVVGINTAIFGIGTGIGFAVPSNLAKALLPQLEKGGAVTRGWLGIGIQDLNAEIAAALSVPVPEGAIVTSVNEGSPAKKAGLLPDDVITDLDGQKISSGGSLTRTVALKPPNSTVSLTVYRKGEKKTVPVTLGTRPDLEGVGRRGNNAEPDAPPAPEVVKPAELGLQVRDLDERMAARLGLPKVGVIVSEVQPGSAAEHAELAPGNLVLELDGKPMPNAEKLNAALKAAKPGSRLLLRVQTPGGRFLRALKVP